MRTLKIKIVILLSSIFAFASCDATASPLTSYLAGKWQVESVHLNTATGRTTEFQWNDPRLVGRIYTFDSEEVSNDAYDFPDTCSRPEASSVRVTFPQLLRRSMGGYSSDQSNSDPVSDYQLNVSKTRQYSAVLLQCKNGRWQGDLKGQGKDSIQGAWIVKVNDRVYLRWRDESILILRKINNPSDIKASFDCSKAVGGTERAICESYELRAFDTSIHDAYSRLIKKFQDDSGDSHGIQKSQREWIEKRNKCNSDTQCLKLEMQSRLNWIGSQMQN